jgi:uncharacterized protein
VTHDVEMQTRDGVVLRADVYRPDVDEKVPAILVRTPYDKSNHSYRLMPTMAAAKAGFAMVVQDVRGRFASEGDWDLANMHDVEAADGYDAVEWAASQAWCDGAIGMFGGSYLGEVQIYTATVRPPSLRAIAPAVTGAGVNNMRRHSMVLESIVIGWMAGRAVDLLQKKMAKGEADPDDLQRIMAVLRDPGAAAGTLPLNDLLTLNTPGFPSYTDFTDLLRRVATAGRRNGSDIGVPALWVSGWYDETGGTDLFREMRASAATEAARTDTRMILGAWSHNYFDNFVGQMGLGNFGSAEGGETPQAHIDFFRRHLRGEDVDIPVVKYFVMGTNEWKEADDWPVPGAEPRAFHLRSGGGLTTAAPSSSEAPDRYTYDPADPVPSFGVRVMYSGGSTVAGPFDQARVERRPDVLVYTSEPLAAPLEIVGEVDLLLFVSSSATDTDFVAKLCDVDRAGNSTNIADGSVRTRWRSSWDEPSYLVPGDITELRIELGMTGHCFRPGHAIRVQVTSSCFPHLERNMNTGNPPGTDVTGVVAEQTVHHSASYPSRVILPVTAG